MLCSTILYPHSRVPPTRALEPGTLEMKRSWQHLSSWALWGNLKNWLERPLCSLLKASWGAPGGLLGDPGGLLDPPGRLLGGSCSLLGSWRPLRAPLETPWSALGELLGVSWRCLGGSWTVLGGVWRHFGGVLKASEGSLDAPESILEASGSCLLDYVKNLMFHQFFIDV